MASSNRTVPVALVSADILRVVEADADMALRGEIVNLFRLQAVQQAHQGAAFGQIPVVEEQARALDLRVGIDGIEPPRLKVLARRTMPCTS